MSTRARVILTVVLGVVMGLNIWLGTEGYSPSPGVEDVLHFVPVHIALFAFFIAVPLVVGRWWVVASLAGLFVALAILELTGHVYEGLGEGSDKPLGSLWALAYYALFMLLLVGIRKLFDFFRTCRRPPAQSLPGRQP